MLQFFLNKTILEIVYNHDKRTRKDEDTEHINLFVDNTNLVNVEQLLLNIFSTTFL